MVELRSSATILPGDGCAFCRRGNVWFHLSEGAHVDPDGNLIRYGVVLEA